MEIKQIGLGILGTLLILGSFWALTMRSYEENLGTSNEFIAKDSMTNLTSGKNDSLLNLSFSLRLRNDKGRARSAETFDNVFIWQTKLNVLLRKSPIFWRPNFAGP